jgi:RNA polymerase sigma-70 factor, ECF subfamily
LSVASECHDSPWKERAAHLICARLGKANRLRARSRLCCAMCNPCRAVGLRNKHSMPQATEDSDSRKLEFASVYEDLRKRARRLLASNDGGSLNTTGLVHEAYLKLANGKLEATSKAHFFHIAATAMRQIIVDHARYTHAQVRDKRKMGTLDAELPAANDGRIVEILALDSALSRLRSEMDTLASVVELHFFAGLSFPEIAELHVCSLSTVERQWRSARAWLHSHMQNDRG